MPFQTTIINGGLDLITSPQSVQPGLLTACKNYEVARLRGLRRIDGFERYDGGPSPSATGGSFVSLYYYNGSHLTNNLQVTLSNGNGNITLQSIEVADLIFIGLTPTFCAGISGVTIPAVGASTATVIANTALFSVGQYCVIAGGGVGGPFSFTALITAINTAASLITVTTVAITQGTAGSLIATGITVTLSDPLGHTTTFGNAILYLATPYAGALSDFVGGLSVGYRTNGDPSTIAQLTKTTYVFNTNSANLNALATSYTAISSTIQAVPGQGNVNGVFWLKDKLYATRDYLSATFTTGTNQPKIGDTLFIGASLGAATFTGQVQGFLLSSGAWSSAITTGNAAGTIVFYNTTGTISNAALNNNTSGFFGIATVTASGATVAAPAAGLYQAAGARGNTVSTQSWQWCDLGFNLQYKAGVIEFVDMNLALTLAGNTQNVVSTGWKFASTGTLPVGWTDTSGAFPNGIKSISGTNYIFTPFLTATPTDVPQPQTFTVTGFGFSDGDIPPTAAIQGLEVQMNSGCIGVTGQYTNSVTDGTFALVGVASGPKPGLADTTTTYTITGGAADVTSAHFSTYVFATRDTGAPLSGSLVPMSNLGYSGILPSDVKSAGFGLSYAPRLNPTGSQTGQKIQFGIHWLQMRVSYLPQTNGIYFWNPTVVTDGAITATTSTLNCATSSPFSLASVGQTVTIAGAGAAGATLVAKITVFNNSGSVSIAPVVASTTVTGATVQIAQALVAQTVMHYKQSGDVTTANAAGALYYQFVTNGVVGGIPSRAVGAGEQIRTYINNGAVLDGGVLDGSTLIATTASAMQMNAMDPSALLTGRPQPDGTTAPASKYQSVTKNFYASAGLEAIYGVSGGGPAFYFDGVKTNASGTAVAGNFSRILTGLPLQFETPRSIVAHQGHIVLGYFSGVIQWSNAVNTLSFNPLLFDRTAGTTGFGDRVVATASINGDTLAVWTQSTIQMVQGNFNVPAGTQTTPTLYTSTLSPTSGGIEYTVQPMQNFMYADFRGITMLGATNKYGDFETGHVSSTVSPWVIPRVQLSAFFESANTGIINSVLIRNKNMVRYAFADGAALSMTYLQDGEPPQFTIQNYTNASGTALTWDVVQAFTERLGRDRIFGATADGSGIVYELERGNSFDGAGIAASATLVPDVAQTPFQNKVFLGINVFGQAQDYATLNLSRSSDYNQPTAATGNNIITETFGASTAAPTGNVTPFVSYGTASLSIEGTAINLRFDSSSSQQFPHYIQAVSYTVDALQEKMG